MKGQEFMHETVKYGKNLGAFGTNVASFCRSIGIADCSQFMPTGYALLKTEIRQLKNMFSVMRC